VRRRILEDPVLISGLVLSLGTAVLFYFRTDVKTALPVVAGLQVSLITLQIQTLLQQGRKQAVETRQQRLIANMERLEWMPEVLDKITTSIWRVDQTFPGTQIISAARSYLERCANDLKDLERGHLKVEWEDIDLVLAQTRSAQRDLRATSVQGVDLSWWLSRPGRRYWQAHKEALARGIRVERVFIYEEWTEELDNLAREQQVAGVSVLRVPYSLLPSRLKTDMIIWDAACGYETQLNAVGDGYRNFFTLDKQDIARMLSDYEAVRNQADEIPEAAP
jgi:hypothetical protein